MRVLDGGGPRGVDAEPPRGLEVDVRRRLAPGDLFLGDGRGEEGEEHSGESREGDD